VLHVQISSPVMGSNVCSQDSKGISGISDIVYDNNDSLMCGYAVVLWEESGVGDGSR
jgi:hypothetical protein